jgi:hypothetical protein
VNRLTRRSSRSSCTRRWRRASSSPGQFYRLQNFETLAPVVDGTRLAMEGLALTGAWVDVGEGAPRDDRARDGRELALCAALEPGEPIVLMGPDRDADRDREEGDRAPLRRRPRQRGLFSIARAFKALGGKVLYFAGYKRGEDLFKQDDIERFTDQVIWCTDSGAAIAPRARRTRTSAGTSSRRWSPTAGQARRAPRPAPRRERIIAIGSDRMMNAVQEARHGVLAPLLDPRHLAIGSINSPMQCMMKEVCAQCLQKQRDPVTGKEYVVFTCFNQDQELDRGRLRAPAPAPAARTRCRRSSRTPGSITCEMGVPSRFRSTESLKGSARAESRSWASQPAFLKVRSVLPCSAVLPSSRSSPPAGAIGHTRSSRTGQFGYRGPRPTSRSTPPRNRSQARWKRSRGLTPLSGFISAPIELRMAKVLRAETVMAPPTE